MIFSGNWTAILVKRFWNYTAFQYNFDLLRVKRNLMSSVENYIYEIPHELLDGLGLRILGNLEVFKKSRIWEAA